MSNKKVLFISYDGMTDPLGQSQVLPYLIGLSKRGFKISILSCEKKDKLTKTRMLINNLVTQHGIEWFYIKFTSTPPIISKYYDLIRLRIKAETLHKEKDFDLIHCRSYVSADIGIYLKRRYGVKFLFDMRGFWVDERVDGGAWNLSNPIYKLAYRKYKIKEAAFIKEADAIISLTEAGKREIETWKSYDKTFIQVIPCSTDFSLFQLIDKNKKAYSRSKLGLKSDVLVLSYLGSIGAWYMLDEMLQFFSRVKKTYVNSAFLFITPEAPEVILEQAKRYNIPASDFVIQSANRADVPFYLSASDINIFFIKQSYSKIASSPTKLGEILAMGLPVICNSKVGDVKEIVDQTASGIVVNDFKAADFDYAISAIPTLLEKDAAQIRSNAVNYYKLEHAIHKYTEVYCRILGLESPSKTSLTVGS